MAETEAREVMGWSKERRTVYYAGVKAKRGEAAVCGRANSLVAKGVLEEIDGGRTRSGRPAKQLRVPVKGQRELFQ